MIAPKVRLGTRGSKLAMAQANSLSALLHQAWPGIDVEIVIVRTSGDRGERDRLGAFVREIQESLLADEVDIALHCLKDLPTETVGGLRLSAYLEREDPRDTLISRGPTLDELPPGAVVGTGSVRRTSQLASHRSDLTFKPLVGNVDTRMRKLIAGEYDAIVLASAGLRRLGLFEMWIESEYRDLVVHHLPPAMMLPAPGQAVLVLETREKDMVSVETVRTLHHAATQTCADAERAFLKAFGGGCSVPVAALAELRPSTTAGEELRLTGLVAAPDGSRVLRAVGSSSPGDAIQLAERLASELGEKGAFDLFRPTPVARGGAGH